MIDGYTDLNVEVIIDIFCNVSYFHSYRTKKYYLCIVWTSTIFVAICLAALEVYLIKTLGEAKLFWGHS